MGISLFAFLPLQLFGLASGARPSRSIRLDMNQRPVNANKLLHETAPPIAFLVDDDSSVRQSVVFLLKSVGHVVEDFSTANEFLKAYDPARPGCLILDVRMPGMGGLELQEYLMHSRVDIPIIIITGYGDIPMAVRAITAGALDFLEKPFNDQALLDRVRHAFALDAMIRQKKEKRQSILALISRLTPREHEIMELLASGRSNNKAIAVDLKISRKTLDTHRGRILAKMQCQSLVELARKAQFVSEDAGPSASDHMGKRFSR